MKNHRYIYYLIGATIILVIINTIFYLRQASQNEKNYLQTLRTSQVIEAANSLLAALKDEETGQRGYLLTHNAAYLAPYKSAEKRIDRVYNALYSFVENKPSQVKKMHELKKLINIKRTETAQTLKFYDEGKPQLALKGINTNIGREAMEKIENLISMLNREEKFILFRHNESFSQLNQRIQIFTIAGSYILLVIIVAALVTIIQNREQIVKLFRQVDDKNKQLEFQKNELQNLSRGLLKQNNELERFAYIISHDLRSPGINLSALLQLYETSDDPYEKEELLKAIKDVSDSLLVKLNDLISMLKSKHETTTEYERIEFGQICNKILSSISADVKKTGATFECDFSEAPGIQYPKSYMESIIQNLITNAIKYRHPGRPPHISINTFKVNDKVCMNVKDNGLGIDLKKHGDRLFGIYQTFHKGSDSKGIGLYITKAQIVAMGGNIEAESIPGEGTTFKICFN